MQSHGRSSKSSEATDVVRAVEISDELHAGDRVVIRDGPFQGLEGALIEQRASRVLLSVHLLHSGVSVEMDRDWIRAAAPGAKNPSRTA